MKQWLLAASLVMLLAASGFLSACGDSSESNGITQSTDLADMQAISTGEEAPSEAQEGRPSGPPQEAFDACVGKTEGDTVTVTTPDGESVSGTCLSTEEGDLALALEDHQHAPRPDREPPQEAFTACEGKSEGDTADLTAPNGESVTGTCRTINGRLVLIPENGRPNGPPPEDE